MENFKHDDFDDLPPIDDDIVANPKGLGEAGGPTNQYVYIIIIITKCL